MHEFDEFEEPAEDPIRPVHKNLHEFMTADFGISITRAAMIVGVPRPRVVETMLLHGWFVRRKPWASLIGHDSAVRAGLVTRRAAIKPPGLLILAALFNKHPLDFIEFDAVTK